MSSGNKSADKENSILGKPIVKETDVAKVKRNLAMPLHPYNASELCQSPSCVLTLAASRCASSPVTELAQNFTELNANENTPKRRLSLSSSGSENPTPDNLFRPISFCLPSSTESSASKRAGEDETEPVSRKVSRDQERYTQGHIYRRCASLSRENINEASPLLRDQAEHRHCTPPPLVVSKTTNLTVDRDRCSPDSGMERDEFRFVPPSIPPEYARRVNEFSPTKAGSVGKVSNFLDYSIKCTADSPALADYLGRALGGDDDGFIDFEELEKQSCQEVPAGVNTILTGRLVSANSHRKHLFRSPSVPSELTSQQHETDRSSFDIRKRVACYNQDGSTKESTTPVNIKRRRAVLSSGDMSPSPRATVRQTEGVSPASLQRCQSMVERSITFTLHRSDSESYLIGDFSKDCCLPLMRGKHPDLNCISADTMARVIQNEFEHLLGECTIVDCRYPYEYEGGHIVNAVNVFTKEEILAKYLSKPPSKPVGRDKRHILIFHCEFSSERAPSLSRFLRNRDRCVNKNNYPSLYYPEIYLLDGGYKAFFEKYKELCEPQNYLPMLHKDHAEDLKNFRVKAKSWAGSDKQGFRPQLKL